MAPPVNARRGSRPRRTSSCRRASCRRWRVVADAGHRAADHQRVADEGRVRRRGRCRRGRRRGPSSSSPSCRWPGRSRWTWLHLALSLAPLMYAMTTLSSDVFCGVTAQIFCGNVSASAKWACRPRCCTRRARLYAAFTATLSVTHRPGASAPEPGASGASLYQSTFDSPAWRPSLRSSGSVAAVAGAVTRVDRGAEPVALASWLLSATRLLLRRHRRRATANTVPPMTSSAATAAPMITAGLPLKGFLDRRPGAGCPGARELRLRRVAVAGAAGRRGRAAVRLAVRAGLLLRLAVGTRLAVGAGLLGVAVAGLRGRWPAGLRRRGACGVAGRRAPAASAAAWPGGSAAGRNRPAPRILRRPKPPAAGWSCGAPKPPCGGWLGG